MRISGIQNFITNNINKVNQNSKNSVKNSTKNNLERSPMQDTVSFGKFDERYESLINRYVGVRLINNRAAYRTLKDSIYLILKPTEETKKNLQNDVYELDLVSLREFRPNEEEWVIKQTDDLMRYHINTFNEIYGYGSDWEKHLTSTEDFEKAARLASYLDNNGYFPSHDNNREEPLDMFNLHDRGYAT